MNVGDLQLPWQIKAVAHALTSVFLAGAVARSGGYLLDDDGFKSKVLFWVAVLLLSMILREFLPSEWQWLNRFLTRTGIVAIFLTSFYWVWFNMTSDHA